MIPISRPFLGPEEATAAAEAIASRWVAQGPRVAEFENAFAATVGARHAVAVSSCTAGLHLALAVLDIGPGDDVVVPSLSFIATANAVRHAGARPVFADVEFHTQNLSPDTVRAALTPATRAVILVHQAGMPADVQALHELCDPIGVAVVEDAACAIGSTYLGAAIGCHSDLVAFSFHPRKVITTGEGGMVATARADWAERLQRLREHGMNMSAARRHASRSPVYERYLETGFNYRMTDIQAAIGVVQLRRLDSIVARRRYLAHRYRWLLGSVRGLQLPDDPTYGTTNFQSFWLILPDDFPASRNELVERMLDREISTRRGIMAAHLEPAYAGLTYDLPVTERLTARSLILPLFHEMTEAEQDRVVDAIVDVAGARAA